MSADRRASYDFLYKVILTGDTGVGKTNLLSRYSRDEFNPNSKATIGAEFSSRILVVDSHRVKLQIWDTAGHEKYRAITAAFYRGAKGALLCFDITNSTSFSSLSGWLASVRDNSDDKCCIILVGCKSDLKEHREVSREKAERFVKEHQLYGYMETSAKDSSNVEETFQRVLEHIYRKELEDLQHFTSREDDDESPAHDDERFRQSGSVQLDGERNDSQAKKSTCWC
uniref:Uncharacterized protein n=1 Tax=Vitrella brassicaformis TaxID=1169539 RepID=A0A7S1KCW4_9ALVE|mmetsp:Transcript_48749/g.122091  ORF Transcript_48749/g.122091 Transcript_48749/m.122091 type:complete len:227 (+) Transcript_48749:93-773(+)